MPPSRELRLLRLAVARGLVSWADLEAVAAALDATPPPEGGPVDAGAWLRRLVEEGTLDPADLEELAAADTAEHPQASPAGGDTPGAPEGPSGSGASGGSGAGAGGRIARDLKILEDWDRYEVVTFLGAGGMGSVYKVFDLSLRRFAAVKLLHGSDPDLERRLLAEARAQARIDHPNVCQVYEVGDVGDRPYIAMQYVDGEPLDRVAAELPRPEVVRLLVDVARAVDAAHRTGLVHRDLKPGNVLVARRPTGGLHPFVVDFGLARDLSDAGRSRSEVITGTPAYLAPEQVRGQPVDARTDVFALGVVLYQLLAGRTPFEAASLPETLIRITGSEAPRLRSRDRSIPRDLETIILHCLEKDPDRRYGSARELAEDLERYLVARPVLARPPGLLYRARTRIRRHRELAIATSVALAVVLTLAGAGLHAWWRAWERAELAQRFGQQVKEVETTLRYATLLPLHDTSAHKEALEVRMEWIRLEMDRLGSVARGPGHYALGQGHLALHDYELARRHLEAAWEAGYREPEVAIALGRTLGHLYTRALTEAEVPAGSAERRAFLREIQRAYREPAASYLRRSTDARKPAPAYVRGLIALYEGRYADALVLAQQADREGTTPGDGRRLEAQVYVIRGNEALEAGNHDEALGFYHRAGKIHRELLETYRSDASLHAADCGRRIQVLELRSRVGRLPPAEIEGALAACGRALVADPGLAEARSKEAHVHWRTAEDRALHGEDPRQALERAVTAARAAIELDPRDVSALSHLSVAHRRLAAWRMSRGLHPGEALERAVDAAARAVDLAPTRASSHLSLGNAHHQRALHLLSREDDPRPELERAAVAYRRAIEINPRTAPAYTNLGAAWKARGEYESERGLDPAPAVEKAIGALEGALAVNPASAPAHNNLGTAHLTLGHALLTRGDDPTEPLERAVASYRRALEINPGYALAHYNLAFSHRCLARHRLRSGADPGPALEAARRALARARELNATDPDNHLEAARIETVQADWERQRGTDPGAAIRRGLEALEEALALQPGMPEALALRRTLHKSADSLPPAAARVQ
ncbi:MAG: protein kinase domain-containing protein [Thermoanaerobaculia bacterium]